MEWDLTFASVIETQSVLKLVTELRTQLLEEFRLNAHADGIVETARC
jgi:hypothetical protein